MRHGRVVSPVRRLEPPTALLRHRPGRIHPTWPAVAQPATRLVALGGAGPRAGICGRVAPVREDTSAVGISSGASGAVPGRAPGPPEEDRLLWQEEGLRTPPPVESYGGRVRDEVLAIEQFDSLLEVQVLRVADLAAGNQLQP